MFEKKPHLVEDEAPYLFSLPLDIFLEILCIEDELYLDLLQAYCKKNTNYEFFSAQETYLSKKTWPKKYFSEAVKKQDQKFASLLVAGTEKDDRLNTPYEILEFSTPLLFSIQNKNLALTKLLIECGAEINFKEKRQKHLSVQAGKYGTPEILMFLESFFIKKGWSFFQNPGLILDAAVQEKNYPAAIYLLKKFLENKIISLYRAINIACQIGSLESVIFILEKTPELTSTDSIQTFLKKAAQNGHKDVFFYLMEKYYANNPETTKDASTSYPTELIFNLTIYAIRGKNTDIIQHLFSLINLEQRRTHAEINHFFISALSEAITQTDLESVQTLLKFFKTNPCLNEKINHQDFSLVRSIVLSGTSLFADQVKNKFSNLFSDITTLKKTLILCAEKGNSDFFHWLLSNNETLALQIIQSFGLEEIIAFIETICSGGEISILKKFLSVLTEKQKTQEQGFFRAFVCLKNAANASRTELIQWMLNDHRVSIQKKDINPQLIESILSIQKVDFVKAFFEKIHLDHKIPYQVFFESFINLMEHHKNPDRERYIYFFQIFDFFLEKKIETDLTHFSSRSLLAMLVENNYASIAELLLRKTTPSQGDLNEAFYLALKRHHIFLAKLLLRHGAAPNAKQTDAFCPLHFVLSYSIEICNIEILDYFLNHGCKFSDLTQMDDSKIKKTLKVFSKIHIKKYQIYFSKILEKKENAIELLRFSITLPDYNLFRELLKNGADISLLSISEQEALIKTVFSRRDIRTTKFLITHRLDFYNPLHDTQHEKTPLMLAVEQDAINIVALLIRNKVFTSATDHEGFTAFENGIQKQIYWIHFEALIPYKNIEKSLIKLFYEKLYDFFKVDRSTCTLLENEHCKQLLKISNRKNYKMIFHISEQIKKIFSTSILIDQEVFTLADIFERSDITLIEKFLAKTSIEATWLPYVKSFCLSILLSKAAFMGDKEKLIEIKNAGAKPNLLFTNGFSLLEALADSEKTDVLEMLLPTKTDPHSPLIENIQPLTFYYVKQGKLNLLESLFKNYSSDALINLCNNFGESLLMHAVRYQQYPIVERLLLEPKLFLEHEDVFGNTAFSLALEKQGTAIIKLLSNTGVWESEQFLSTQKNTDSKPPSLLSSSGTNSSCDSCDSENEYLWGEEETSDYGACL